MGRLSLEQASVRSLVYILTKIYNLTDLYSLESLEFKRFLGERTHEPSLQLIGSRLLATTKLEQPTS